VDLNNLGEEGQQPNSRLCSLAGANTKVDSWKDLEQVTKKYTHTNTRNFLNYLRKHKEIKSAFSHFQLTSVYF
jgi:accessory colonization factor AcfC